MNVLQIKRNVPNPIKLLSGYKPVTDYWDSAIVMANTLISTGIVLNSSYASMRDGANAIVDGSIFVDKQKTPEQWAELVMALNHIGWILNELEDKSEYVIKTINVFDYLYRKWHKKALKTLKGDDLARYLEITD